ncbi:MAG: ABC transporter substrate-binding protein [Treponema sp.]|jgi:NitT/TauT family transport system substrate-binding protein|nr:ABC transporter substrate-binding protein [Treponema sp.]
MKKKIIISAILVLFISIFLCLLYVRGKSSSVKEITIYAIKGPSGVGMIRLFEEPPEIKGFNVKIETLAQSNLMAARFIAGEVKVGILPPDIAAKIAASGRDIRAAAVMGEGMLKLLTADPQVQTLKDLKGKSVEIAGQGATPDYVFQRILKAHGLSPNTDVMLGYSLAYPEIAQSLIAGRVSTALLPEPFATMAVMGKPDLKSITDIQEEWAKESGGGNYPITLLVVDGTFASEENEALEAILNAVRASSEWVRSHPAEAGALVEKHELGLRAAIVAAAIPKSNYVFIPAAEARPSLEALFRVFLENEPSSIGGSLPNDRFYLK